MNTTRLPKISNTTKLVSLRQLRDTYGLGYPYDWIALFKDKQFAEYFTSQVVVYEVEVGPKKYNSYWFNLNDLPNISRLFVEWKNHKARNRAKKRIKVPV